MRQMVGDHGGLHRIRLEGSLDEQARLLVHLTDCDHSERWHGNILYFRELRGWPSQASKCPARPPMPPSTTGKKI
jgi:hypothetical protein